MRQLYPDAAIVTDIAGGLSVSAGSRRIGRSRGASGWLPPSVNLRSRRVWERMTWRSRRPVARSSLTVPMGVVPVSGKLSIYRVIRAAMTAVRRCETAAKSCFDARPFTAR